MHNKLDSINDSNNRVGIIVPIYNVEKYLKRCLDSILQQCYTNYYVVLVNDGSTDNSLEIAKDYVARDKRFILFDKENGGDSMARNIGIDFFAGVYNNAELCLDSNINNNGGGGNLLSYTINQSGNNPLIDRIYLNTATNTNTNTNTNTISLASLVPSIDYMIFIDSDDYWIDTILQDCIKASDGVDVVWFDYDIECEGDITIPSNHKKHLEIFGYDKAQIISNIDWLHQAIKRNVTFSSISPWTIMFNFSFLNRHNIRFLHGVRSEDTLFSIMWFSLAKRVAILPKSLYVYYWRSGSTNNFDKTKNFNSIPHYFIELCSCYKDFDTLYWYYQIASFFIMTEFLIIFLDNMQDKEVKSLVEKAFLPTLLDFSIAILEFPHDPLGLIPRFPILKPYITKDMKLKSLGKCALNYPKLVPLLKALRNIEKSLRLMLKELFAK